MTTTSRTIGPAAAADSATDGATVSLPFGIGDVSAVALASAVGAAAALVAWLITGAAVAVPLSLIGGIALASAIEDHRTGRIPNSLVLAGVVVLACSWGFVATLDNRMMRPLFVDMVAGLALGGAPIVFLVWFVAPRLIGGGDWKLLTVLGSALGALAPPAASLIPIVAFASAIAASAIHRRRHIRLGPFLAVGYGAAIASAVVAPTLFGNSYW